MTQTEKQIFYEKLSKEHKGIFYKVAGSYCKNVDDKSDLLQEMMLQVWKSLDRYNNEYKLSTWLYRICLNVAISYYRKQTIRRDTLRPIDDYSGLAGEENAPIYGDDRSQLMQFISELNNIDKALILLYLEDYDHSEMAEVLGISKSNVGTKIGRIKEQLKNKFKNLEK